MSSVSICSRTGCAAASASATAIPKGSRLVVVYAGANRDPKVWGDDPDRFDPDRFLPEREGEITSGAYIPFGLGPRVCLGQHFAVLEMTLIAALVLQRGYAWLSDEHGQTISRVGQTHAGQAVRATLADGKVDLTVSPQGKN